MKVPYREHCASFCFPWSPVSICASILYSHTKLPWFLPSLVISPIIGTDFYHHFTGTLLLKPFIIFCLLISMTIANASLFCALIWYWWFNVNIFLFLFYFSIHWISLFFMSYSFLAQILNIILSTFLNYTLVVSKIS